MKRSFGVLGVLLVLGSGLITIGERENWSTPTWRQIYAAFGVGETVAVPATADDAKTKIHFIDVGQADACRKVRISYHDTSSFRPYWRNACRIGYI